MPLTGFELMSFLGFLMNLGVVLLPLALQPIVGQNSGRRTIWNVRTLIVFLLLRKLTVSACLVIRNE